MSSETQEIFQKLSLQTKSKEFGDFMSKQEILFVIAKKPGIYHSKKIEIKNLDFTCD